MKNISSLDPALPLAPFHFHTTGESTWSRATGDKLTSLLVRQRPPEFRTILGTAQPYPADDYPSPDVLAGVGYVGPFHADFDGATLEEIIPPFLRFLRKLQDEFSFDMAQARIFATGKKGFHIEIPAQCFMPDMPAEGIPHLPYIYREMAMELFVDGLDIRVYSGKRGRMWRVPNRLRENGRFKVPVEPRFEILEVTPERYLELCAMPRPWPHLAPPTLNTNLALLFDRCRDKVLQSLKRRQSSLGVEKELRRRFRGKLPPSLEAVAHGRIPSTVGFNRLALQLAISAHAVGMGEDALIAECAGLIRNHASDGRYNTPRRREDELRKQWRYIEGNPCYSASVGGIRSVLPKGLNTRDLRGLGT